MKYIKTFEENTIMSTYNGPPIVNKAVDFLVADGSDGLINGGPGFGMTGAMGGEFPKKYNPSIPYTPKYKYKIKNIKYKESKNRKNAIKKLKKLNKIKYFDEFNYK